MNIEDGKLFRSYSERIQAVCYNYQMIEKLAIELIESQFIQASELR